MKRIITTILTTSSILFVLFAIIALFIFLYPFNIIDVQLPITIINPQKTVSPNGIVEYNVNYKKHYDIPAIVSKQLVLRNKRIYNYDAQYDNLCIKETNVIGTLSLPQNVSKSYGKIRIIAVYKLFGIREVPYTYETEEFYISE
jgi:hypothetical protein